MKKIKIESGGININLKLDRAVIFLDMYIPKIFKLHEISRQNITHNQIERLFFSINIYKV